MIDWLITLTLTLILTLILVKTHPNENPNRYETLCADSANAVCFRKEILSNSKVRNSITEREDKKDAENIKKATKIARWIFNTYLREKNTKQSQGKEALDEI